MKRPVIAVFNPGARGGRIARARESIRSNLEARSASLRWEETGDPEQGRQIASAADPDTIVVAIGGDGTVHHVACGVIDSGAILGVWPAGTGNDFAFALGLRRGKEPALDTIRHVDAGSVRLDGGATHCFVNAVGIGFDAASTIRAERRRFLPGVLRYHAAILETLLGWRSPEATIVADEQTWRQDVMFVTVSNGPRSGGDFLISPDADVSDGLLDLCAVHHMSPLRAARLIPKVVAGSHETLPQVRTTTLRQINIDIQRPLPVHADGEVISEGASRVAIQIEPGRLRVAV
jgi:YegS/Rv2252/BmrU family lipid kinase